MSAAVRLSEVASAGAGLLAAAFGWICVAPVAWAMPRRRDRIVVIGRDDGKFVDNAKHFYLQALGSATDLRCTFLTERADTVSLLRANGCPVVRYPSFAAIWCMLRSGTLVVDSTDWYQRLRRFLAAGAKVVQLWHGVGFKRIELDKWRNEAPGRGWVSHSALRVARTARRVFLGRVVTYDLVNTTSSFYLDRVFSKAFRSRHFLSAGYPRNAFGRMDPASDPAAWCNVDARIGGLVRTWLGQARRVVLVAPTFRDSRATPLGLDPSVRSGLDDWCAGHGVELLFKFHPLERGAESVQGKHLHLYPADSDIYPLLPSLAALVTDYSSIYMDYLLIDRPVAFLVPDLAEYLRTDRQIQFDFAGMTPGPKVEGWPELMSSLLSQWQDDVHAGERHALRRMAFDDASQEGATQALLDFMRSRGWLPAQPALDPQASVPATPK